jgi:pilus assembly protein CpaF
MIIDNATPIAQGHLPNNTRITALKTPIVDDDCGIAVSIRLLHPQRVDRQCLIDSGMATEEMVSFLEMCIRYGVSLVVAGRTSSGKTTLLNALLTSIPNAKRSYSIESGARELFLVRRDRLGDVKNNVVHTLTRPSENAAYNISQENLVVAALRFDPDIVVVGEIRDAEANSAVEASLTGHTVVTTVHSGPAESAHGRISLLCQRRFQLGMEVSLAQSRQAFPLVVFAHKCEDNSRKIMDISECAVSPEGKTEYRCLYRYEITKNDYVDSKYLIEGHFVKVNQPSEHLCMLLTRNGVPKDVLESFLDE